MVERDFEPFTTMLDDVWGFYPAAKVPSTQQKAIFFRALSDFSIAQVRKAFDGHVKDAQRGRFAPLPADIVAQIEGAKTDGRPGPEEAWSVALSAADEAKSLVWTDEMAQAWGICKAVFDTGDQIGARMAFKEAYARLVTESRAHGVAVKWTASLGHDANGRDEVIERAQLAGLLPPPERLKELAGPGKARSASDVERERLKVLCEKISGKTKQAEESSTPIGPFSPIPAEACPWNKPQEAA